MYHSITFDDKNTWDDWCLIPNGRPVFTPPEQKTNYLDIPGANGSLDMSEALTGYPVYNNREGTFSFIIMNKNAVSYPECNPRKLDDIYSEIMSYLHGKVRTAILEDDPGYKYKGRFRVSGITPGADWTTIDIDYNVNPFKRSINGSINNWEVDNTVKTISLSSIEIGDEAVCPNFIVTSTNGQGVYVRLINPTLNIDKTKLFQNGTSSDHDFILYGDNVEIKLYTSSGTGSVAIEFYPGRL